MKLSHVIPCDAKISNLGYKKIVFDNGYVADKDEDVVRWETITTSVSRIEIMVMKNGESATYHERWLKGKNANGKYVIETIAHGNLDANGNFYTTRHYHEVTDEQLANLRRMKVFES